MAHQVGQLSEKYGKITDIVTIIVFVLFALLFAAHHRFELQDLKTNDVQVQDFKIEDVEITRQVEKQVAPQKVSIPVAVEDEELLDEDIQEDIVMEEFTSFDQAPPPPPAFIETEEDEEAIPFFRVEVKPEMIGGQGALYENLEYPDIARRAKKDGKVTLKFTVDKTGKPTNITILREVPADLGFGQAAMNALKQVKFQPGVQAGKEVAVNMTWPVIFRVKK